MDNLKEFIENNRDSFEQHSKADSSNAEKLYRKIVVRRRIKVLWAGLSAAVVIISIFLNMHIQNKTDDHKTQIISYKLKEQEIINKIYSNTYMNKEDIANTIDIITRESIPFEEQLPKEMPKKDKTEAIKEYNEQRLDALNTLLIRSCNQI